MPIRIFFAVDAHGATEIWKKWIKASEMHNPNILMLCGDLSGKALVPLIKTSNCAYKAFYFGKEWTLKNEHEIREFEEKIENIGVYSARMTQDEYDELKSNSSKVKQLILNKIIDRIDRWLAMLTSRINLSKTKIIVMPGNDDDFEIDSVIQQYENKGIIYPLNKVVEIADMEIISLAHVNPTPWNTSREANEENLETMIVQMVSKIKEIDKSIFNFHAPPYGTRLDIAPQIDRNKKPVIIRGQISLIHVGSKAVRKAIENYQPLLGLHGHIHESSGAERIGRTIIVNPGSEYSEGILRAYIIEIHENFKINYWRLEG